MATLYESLCISLLESTRLDNQAKTQSLEIARRISDGIRQEFEAPERTLYLVNDMPDPEFLAVPDRDQYPQRAGHLSWAFRYALAIRYPSGDAPMSIAWGDFVIRKNTGGQSRHWGIIEWPNRYEVDNPPDQSLIQLLANELFHDVTRMLENCNRSCPMSIGFSCNEE